MRSVAGLFVVLMLARCAADPRPTPVPTSTPTATERPPSPTPATSPTAAVTPRAVPTSPAVSPTATATQNAPSPVAFTYVYEEFDVPAGARPHDVATAPDGMVWYTGQANGTAGRLDPATGEVIEVDLGNGSAPHGVIVGPDEAIWVTDQGLNALVRIFPDTLEVTAFPMPDGVNAGPHTPTVDVDGVVWFTGQNGYIGRLDPGANDVELFDVPRGRGPYGIDVTPGNEIWYVSLDESYLGRIARETGEIEVFEPPTQDQGARRVWSDSTGRMWITEWNAGQLGMYDPASGQWREWPMPGPGSQPYAIYVDELDHVWITDFGTNAIVRFDPATEVFDSFPIPTADAAVRQLIGREGELWGAESATDKLLVLRRQP